MAPKSEVPAVVGATAATLPNRDFGCGVASAATAAVAVVVSELATPNNGEDVVEDDVDD